MLQQHLRNKGNKTKDMRIDFSRVEISKKYVLINGQPIQSVTNYKNLGVLDNKLK